MTAASLTPSLTMEELLLRLPGARRALFRLYHIGGCQSCAFRPDETLAEVCQRNGGLDPNEVLGRITAEAEREAAQLIEPKALQAALQSPTPPRLVDLRSEEEFQVVHLPGSQRLTQPLLQEILQSWPRGGHIVLLDHRGERGLDGAAYLAGHGMTNVQALRGGIDAWALEVAPELPRYEVEAASAR